MEGLKCYHISRCKITVKINGEICPDYLVMKVCYAINANIRWKNIECNRSFNQFEFYTEYPISDLFYKFFYSDTNLETDITPEYINI